MSQIDKALAIAAIAHRNQVRKGTDIPYFVHPVRVGMILQEYGCSEDVICAGILHDTVEDTDMTLSILSLEFNDNVARIVEGWAVRNRTRGLHGKSGNSIPLPKS